MKRSLLRLLPVTALFAAACAGGDRSLPTAPNTETTPAPSIAPGVSPFIAQNCSASSVTTLVGQLLPQPLATSISLLINQLRTQASNGQRDRAQATALRVVDQLIKARNGGLFANDPAKLTRLGTLIQLILCVVDLPQPAIDLSTRGGAAIITPTSPPTTVTTGDRLAGVTVPTGAVTQTTLVTVTPAPGTGPLLTDLDQYPLFYEFGASPAPQFAQKVTVGVCTAGDVSGIFPRLRLAHNIGTNIGDIEVLPLAPAPFLDCTTLATNARPGHESPFASLASFRRWATPFFAKAFLPTPAYAAVNMFRGCCLGGLAGSFSPFGAVDTASIVIDSVGAGSFGGATGSTVSPVVIARKSADAILNPGAPARGIDVTFSVTGGTGSATPLTVRTGTDGRATTSWTLAAGDNALQARAVNGRASVAGGTTSIVPGSPLTFRASASTAATFSYGAPGWRTRALAPTGFDAGWLAPGFYDGNWALGQAGFGMPNPPDTYCSFYSPNKATTLTFLPSTSLVLRRRFTAPNGASTGVLAISVDNDVKVYVNGVALTSAVNENGNQVTPDEGGYFVHEGCPTADEFVFPLSGLSATDNVLTIIARDRGGSTYFDAEVRATPPPIP